MLIFVYLLVDLIFGFYSYFTWETGGLELASTVILVFTSEPETETIHNIGSRNNTLFIPIKFLCDYLYISIIYESIFTAGASH